MHTVSGIIFNTVLRIQDVLCLMQPAYDYYNPYMFAAAK